MNQDYVLIKAAVGVLGTLGLYSVLYRETRFYRLFEHIFLGLAVGWSLVALWTEVLKQEWWDKMVGVAGEPGTPGSHGYWAYMLLLPIGLMGYFVFSKKHNWMSRVPIGIILGFWSGQQVEVWWRRFGPQINNSLKPVVPTTFDSLGVPASTNLSPEALANIQQQTYLTQALSNVVFVLTILCVLSYFIFSIDLKDRVGRSMTMAGRYLLMVGFGAIFGSTVMMRFTLLIDRLYFVWVEFLTDGLLRRMGMG